MLPPHWVVRDAARLASTLADQARRSGDPDHAAYFEQVANEANGRADYLMLLWTRPVHPTSVSARPPRGSGPSVDLEATSVQQGLAVDMGSTRPWGAVGHTRSRRRVWAWRHDR